MDPTRDPGAPIRPATAGDLPAMAVIARAAKASWGYDAALVAQWAPELVPTARSLQAWPTFVAVSPTDGPVGFCQLDLTTLPFELAHLWVHPSWQRRGVGRALLAAALQAAAERGGTEVTVESDPNAERFYLAMGGQRIGARPAPIPGSPGRMLPRLSLPVTVRAPGRTR